MHDRGMVTTYYHVSQIWMMTQVSGERIAVWNVNVDETSDVYSFFLFHLLRESNG